MRGVYVESSGHGHVSHRAGVLRAQRWYPAPDGVVTRRGSAASSDLLAHVLLADLSATGIAVADLDRLLDNHELISLAAGLGEPQPQLDERLQPWVEDGVVLLLRADLPETDDLTWQLLFAENYVMLHTELAGRPSSIQPRYLLFQCVDPPPRDQGGQTILVPMSGVHTRLTDAELDVLAETRHGGFEDPPPFVRWDDSTLIVSFKDAEGEDIPWRYEGHEPSVTPTDVNDALGALYAAIYDPAGVRGLEWKPRRLAVFDNFRFLHGRTFGPRPAIGNPRFLREVRIEQPV